MMRLRLRERLTIRAALLLGFGLTFGVWLYASYHFAHRMAEVEQRTAAINARYMQAQEQLSTIRSNVLMGSVYVRDALVEPNPATAADYRRRLNGTYRDIDEGLQRYVPVVDSPEERRHVAELYGELEGLRATMQNLVADGRSRSPEEAAALLRSRLVPRRALVMRMSENVQALNRIAFMQQQSALAEVYGFTQRRVWQILVVALAASFGIAVVAIVYAGGLERRIRQQRGREVRSTRDLHRLSAKLIRAQEEERRTIARELHDEVGQVLMTIKVELAVAEREIAATGGPPRVLQRVRSIADSAVHTVRDLSHLLHPALLDDLGLPDAVDWYVREFSRRHGVQIELVAEGLDERLPAEIETAAYRIIQEALTNVGKHAGSATCRVSLSRLERVLLIAVEDDGIGFDPSLPESSRTRRGLGLIGLRERASHLRGRVQLCSAPGQGTRLTVELPVPSGFDAKDRAAGAESPEAEALLDG